MNKTVINYLSNAGRIPQSLTRCYRNAATEMVPHSLTLIRKNSFL